MKRILRIILWGVLVLHLVFYMSLVVVGRAEMLYLLGEEMLKNIEPFVLGDLVFLMLVFVGLAFTDESKGDASGESPFRW